MNIKNGLMMILLMIILVFEIDFGKDYGVILFSGETNKTDEFFKIIDDTLRSIGDLDTNLMNGLKRRYFGREVRSLDNFESLAINYMRTSFYNLNFFDYLQTVETISEQEIMSVFKLLDKNNNLELIIKPKNSK